ncbi:MAG TPA: glycosyltransferase family 1 protein [Magnetospirillum sp.]|jgi:glycosyltransferase involved in cell wall biosynthesis|nr:glycosyltransferase family 1 protein [Magnetospirillum sp.]
METARPIRALINALHAKSGGGITYLRAMLPELADDSRLSLVLLVHRHTLDLFQPLDPRIQVHAVDLPGGLIHEMLWEQVKLPSLVRQLGVGVVFSPANFGPVLCQRQVLLLRNDVTVGRDEPRLSKKLYWWALTALTWASLARSARAIAVSAYAAGRLSFGFDNKVTVVHHGVSPLFQPDPQVTREDFLLAVSDVYVQKNFLTLVRALAALRASHPSLRLVVAGRVVDPWYHRQVLDLAVELGVADAINFVGHLAAPALRDLYRRCRVFVFPSTAETFGNPLVEAMACAAPVVSSNAAALPEVVGDAALLFDPLDVDALARQLTRVLEEPGLSERMSVLAAQRGRQFSWSRTARATADMLVAAALGNG